MISFAEKQTTEKSYVLVTGSRTDNDKLEVIDKEGQTTVCSSTKFPTDVRWGTGGVLREEKVLICGGYFTKECYIMGIEMRWTKHTDMKEFRYTPSSMVIQDYLWVTGGWDGNKILETTEKIHLNGRVEFGINLPYPVEGHCMVEHLQSVYLLGGRTIESLYRKDVLKYQADNEFSHSVGQSMTHKRFIFACGVFYSQLHSNRPIIVVAGSHDGPGKKTGEFWDFTNPQATWQLTGGFPSSSSPPYYMRALRWGAQMSTTQNEDGVILTHEYDIFKLVCNSPTSFLWKKEPTSLKIRRNNHLMFKVPSKLMKNCSYVDLSEKKYALVTGLDGYADEMEVIDKDGKTTICSTSKFPSIPLSSDNLVGATGGVFEENILICGGRFPITKECHIMGIEMSWTKHADMKETRYLASSTVIQDYLWVTGGESETRGGRGSRGSVQTTEKIHLNGRVEPGIDLPYRLMGHCMVQHNQSVYLLGGNTRPSIYPCKKAVLKYQPENEFTHSVGQPMIHGRYGFACGVFYSQLHSNRPLMVAAGSSMGSGMRAGEFWDFTNPAATWQPTGDFPYYLDDGPQMTATQNGDGVLLTYENDIFNLECTSTTSCLWKEEPTRLKISRHFHLMFTVPSKLLKNCSYIDLSKIAAKRIAEDRRSRRQPQN